MKNKQYAIQALLILQTLGLLLYTAIAIQNDGFNFVERFQEFAFSMKWIGQFTLDFQCYLILSAVWITWRNKFTINSILFAIIAMILGIIVFAPYFIYLIQKEKGDMTKVLIGNRKTTTANKG